MNLSFSSVPNSVPDDWYAAFFSAPINAFWESLVPPSVTEQDVAFIERHLGVVSGAQILDVPCGAGRHSLALARRGFLVTGVDLSADAVTRAGSLANNEGLSLTVHRQDMSRLDLNGSFAGAICMGNSFGYLTHKDMQSYLRYVHDCLLPDARFVIDTGMTAESILANLKRTAKYEVSGYAFEVENDYDVARSRLVSHTVLSRGAERWQQSFSHGVYTCAELDRLLQQQGFAVEGWYSDTADTPFTLGQARLLLVARRT